MQFRQTKVAFVSLLTIGCIALALKSGTPIPLRKFLRPLKVNAYFYCIVKINNKSLRKRLVTTKTWKVVFSRALKFEELFLGEHKHKTSLVKGRKARTIRIPNDFWYLLKLLLGFGVLWDCGCCEWNLANRSAFRRPEVKSARIFSADVQVVWSWAPN